MSATNRTITSVLVANRGEIARRVFTTCRALGIRTVAVFSDADAGAPHVAEADAAVRLPGDAPADTYLRFDLIVDAARRAGADAVHPGYGFGSENATFARAVIDAGLVWIGPSPEAIGSMGSKITAKRLMADAGVPVLDRLDPGNVTADDLPVLIKASAGGGGRGMRIVESLDVLADELTAAAREARSAFGDDAVFCEPYLARAHHVEVQILADTHGTVWALGERECSIQRRHQKIVEEAPSPLVERTPGMREALFEAAVGAARAIDYTGAGTVEFLADDSGRFFFLEMNTRLQVEHPVTEATFGVDLVALQIAVAEGRAIPAAPPAPTGHAIEVRLYSEDPANAWQPQTGTVHRVAVPGVTARFARPAGVRCGLRLDSGVTDGSVVGIHYDPMIAKVIAWAPHRADAARHLATAVESMQLHGLITNRDLLVNILCHDAFVAGDTHIAFLGDHDLATLAAPLVADTAVAVSALAAALADAARNRREARVLGDLPSGWRNVPSGPQTRSYRHGDETIDVAYCFTRDGLVTHTPPGVTLVSADPDEVVLTFAGVRRRFDVAAYPGVVEVDSSLGSVRLEIVERFVDPADVVDPGSLGAPMPGSVIRIAVAVGETVTKGQALLWLEAMKMEHRIDAPADGVVAELPVEVGQQVDVGTPLVVLATPDEGDEP